MPRVVTLPNRGRLIVGTDFQGNVADFDRLAALFEKAAERPDGATLVVTGDLVHGPEIVRQRWPEYLGSFYVSDSVRVLQAAVRLSEKFPGRVHYLLGNHEHAHIGGPIVSKFFADEANRLEVLLGPSQTQRIRSWFATWPLVVHAPSAGIILTHGAPNAIIESAEDVECARLELPDGEIGGVDELVAELLWARSASEARARAFMAAIHPDLNVAIYGHDVARAGYAIDREPLLCISTSFGCFDGDKLYLDWDLARSATSAAELAADALFPLYPDAPPVYGKRISEHATPEPDVARAGGTQ